MTDLDQRIIRLVGQARGERTPSVDVRGAVLSLLGNESGERWVLERPMVWMAALSSTLALAVVAVVVLMYYRAADPLLEVANSISWVIQ